MSDPIQNQPNIPLPQQPMINRPAQTSVAIDPVGTPKANPSKMMAIIIGIFVCILLVGFLYIRSTIQSPKEPEATVTPTTIPSPTPSSSVSKIATTSAFAAYSEEIASFSATLNAFTLQDSTLAPPILELNLGLDE